MSKADAIKTFRDLLSFLTVVPLAKTDEFVFTSARNMWLFPLMGGFIGICSAGYFLGARFILNFLVDLLNFMVVLHNELLIGILGAVMTMAFLLVFTGFQHFDGLVDLGNALGIKQLEDRKEIAHRWIVTTKGAFLAIFVELTAVVGLFVLSGDVGIAVRALVVAEVAAKLAMVTIVWRGRAAHEGLGSRFISYAKRKLNFVAYGTAVVLGFILMGIAGVLAILVSALFGFFMMHVGNRVFGGVSGDIIGATNEGTRALILVFVALTWGFFAGLFWGGMGI
ncbi:MAG: adenosylcobinamide-GDP ribazoletransferase [Candidatus Bathyarchaeota archaeon]|nr:adenosylcobinamide-GDP ribazoletransferase [Candidatus Bathyarchaeota archaeon]